MAYKIKYETKDTNGLTVEIGNDVRPDGITHVDANLIINSLHSLVCKYVKDTAQLNGTQARKDARAYLYKNDIKVGMYKLKPSMGCY